MSFAARDDWPLPGRVLHLIQACEAREARYWCHPLFSVHPSEVGQAQGRPGVEDLASGYGRLFKLVVTEYTQITSVFKWCLRNCIRCGYHVHGEGFDLVWVLFALVADLHWRMEDDACQL